MSEEQRELEMALAAQQTGPSASPSVPYIKYIMEDTFKPDNLPPALCAVVYDKELALSNLKEDDISWLRDQLQRSVINFKNGRPISSTNYKEEITLSVLPAKFLIKLARSRDGGFERKQQTTQTVIRQAVVSGQPMPGRRWSIFGKRKGGEVK